MIRLRCPRAPVRSLTFSPDGDLLAGAGPEEVWCWCASRGWGLTGLKRSGWVGDVAFHPGGRTLAFIGPPPTAPGWRGWLAAKLTTDPPAVWFHSLADNGAVAPDALPLWPPGSPPPGAQGGPAWTPCLAFSADGNTVISNTLDEGSFFRFPRHAILQWQLTDAGPTRVVNPEPQRFGTEDGTYRLGDLFVMIGGFGMRACPFDPGDRRPIVAPRLSDAAVLAVARVGEWVATANPTGIHIWHLRERAPVAVLPPPPGWSSGTAAALGFSPDGAVLAVGNWNGVTIWNPLSGDRGKSFDFGVGRVMSVAYSPDGLLLAVGGTRGVVVIDVD